MNKYQNNRGVYAFMKFIINIVPNININDINKYIMNDIENGNINYYVAILHTIKNNNIKMFYQLNKRYKMDNFKNILLSTATKYNINGSHSNIINYIETSYI